MNLKAGRRLAIIRKWAGLSRAGFGIETGISESRLYDLERLRQKIHDTDIESICKKYPELANFIACGGPARLMPNDLLMLKAAAVSCEHDPTEIDSTRTRLVGTVWVSRDDDIFAPELVGKVSRIDYYQESTSENGTESFAVAVLRGLKTYCETGLLILSSDGELEVGDKEGKKLQNLKPDHVNEYFVRAGTKEKVQKIYEIWESDLIKT